MRLVKWSHSPNHNEKLKEVIKYEKSDASLKGVPPPDPPFRLHLLYVKQEPIQVQILISQCESLNREPKSNYNDRRHHLVRILNYLGI